MLWRLAVHATTLQIKCQNYNFFKLKLFQFSRLCLCQSENIVTEIAVTSDNRTVTLQFYTKKLQQLQNVDSQPSV